MKTWTLWTLLALGCAGPQVTQTTTVVMAPAAAATRGLDTVARPLELRATATVLATRQPLRDGMTLRSGNTLRLAVEVTRPAFVFVAYIDKHDRVVLLHTSAERVEPGVAVQVPSEQDLLLDEETGEEHLLLVASQRLLTESDPELHAALHRTPSVVSSAPAAGAPEAPLVPRERHRARARPQPVASVAAPSAAPVLPEPTQAGAVILRRRPRGIGLTPSIDAAPLTVQADEGGVVAWRVDFHHVP